MPAGRPTKLTPGLQQSVITHIMGGSYVETAAKAVGINKVTV